MKSLTFEMVLEIRHYTSINKNIYEQKPKQKQKPRVSTKETAKYGSKLLKIVTVKLVLMMATKCNSIIVYNGISLKISNSA